MARKYTITSGRTAIGASGTSVAAAVTTGASLTATIIGLDCTFDSTATGSGAIPATVSLVRVTTASSGGSTATPAKWYSVEMAAQSGARINDTTDGSGTVTVLESWQVSPTSGISIQYPLGREPICAASEALELRIVSQAGMTACNYVGSLFIEE